MLLAIQIGFFTITIADLIDIFVVGWLIYWSYKLLRGSTGLTILIGVIVLFLIGRIISSMGMLMLSALFDQFAELMVIILIVIFQPEVRRFLIMLGNNTLRQRSHLLRRLLDREFDSSEKKESIAGEIKNALIQMSRKKWGALIVLAQNEEMMGIIGTGVPLHADISQHLLESIFNKQSPLHDGAVIISHNKIIAAGCTLPVSDNPNLPKTVGLRHRAAVGITERMEVVAFVVSEETGSISYAYRGKLDRRISENTLSELLKKWL